MISPDLFAYSVVLGPDGMIYSAGSLGVEPQGVVRIDPETGERTELAMFPPGGAARSLGFSVDASRLYIGTAGYERGVIYVLELDDQLDPVGSPEIFVEDAGDGWQDAIAVDACDNLYVPDSHALRLYRVSPDGDAQVYVDWTAAEERYGHDARFGPPRGGWRTDALYMPTPYGDKAMKELVIGVPSREFAGEVLNRP